MLFSFGGGFFCAGFFFFGGDQSILFFLNGLLAHDLGVLELGVLELVRCHDNLHGDDQVPVLLVVDFHAAWALRVVHEATFDKGNLHGRLVDIVLAKLGKVQVVRVNFLSFTMVKTAAVYLGYRQALVICAGLIAALVQSSNKVVCLTHLFGY